MEKTTYTPIIIIFLLIWGTMSYTQNIDTAMALFETAQYEKASLEFENALPGIEQQYGKNDTSHYSVILLHTGVSFHYTGDLKKAENYYLSCISVYRNNKAIDDLNFGYCLNYLAVLYESLEQYEDAIPLLLEAGKNTEKAYGKDNAVYSTYMDNLARIYIANKQMKKALPIYLEALENIEKQVGKDQIEYGNGLYKLAELYELMGLKEKALPVYLEALKYTEKEYGKSHAEYIVRLNNLAVLYQSLGQNYKAETYYLEVMQRVEKDDPSYRTYQRNLASLYVALERYSYAFPLYLELTGSKKDAFESMEKTQLEYAIHLNHWADYYFSAGEYEKALPYSLEALENIAETLGNDDADYGNCLGQLADIYKALGQYDDALPLYIDALENKGKALGKDHPGYGIVLGKLGSLYKTMGYYQKALPLYLESLENAEKTLGKDHSEYGICLNNLSLLYKSMGQYEKALPLSVEALENARKTVGKDDSFYGICLHNLAEIYVDMGEYEKALPLFLEGLKNAEKTVGKNHLQYGESLNSLGALYLIMEQYEKALPLYLEALEIAKSTTGTDGIQYGSWLNNLAMLYDNMGQLEKALPLYIESLENIEKFLGKDHAEYGIRQGNLAGLYESMGNYEEALTLFLESLSNAEITLGTNHPQYGLCLNNLAGLCRAAGFKEEALGFYLKSLENTAETVGKNHPSYGLTLNNLGVFYGSSGDYEKAISIFREAIENTEKTMGKTQSRYAVLMNNLAEAYKSNGQNDEAMPLALDAIEVIRNNIDKNFVFLSEKEREAYLKTVNHNFEIFNSFALQHKDKAPEIVDWVYDNMLINKGMLLKSSSAMRTAIVNSGNADLIHKFNEWTDISKQIAYLYSIEKSKRTEDPAQLEERANVLEKELVSESQEFKDFSASQNLTWKDVQKSLAPNEAAIEFISFNYAAKRWTDSVYYCALILKKGYAHPEMVFLCVEELIMEKLKNKNGASDNRRVDNLYAQNRGGKVVDLNPDETYSSANFYSFIWEPMEELLKGVETVWLSPAGLLHKISFNAVSGNDSILLIDKYAINYVTSTREVVGRDDTRDLFSKNSTADFYGGINYQWKETQNSIAIDGDERSTSNRTVVLPKNIGSRGSINPLPGTLKEVTTLDGIFTGNHINVQLFTGDTASETSFKQYSGKQSPTLIHFATHGFYFEKAKAEKQKVEVGQVSFRGLANEPFLYSDNPMVRSGLLMAGASRKWSGEEVPAGSEDGILTAQEISNLNLSNTKLVVLSACETGLGDISGSEGIFGLQRSLKMAGVKYIIESLWQVPDEQTVELMTLFYNGCFSGLPIREAFRQAQLALSKKYSPYYWAAFVLIE